MTAEDIEERGAHRRTDGCHGIVPLTARLEAWQQRLAADPTALTELLDRYGSPLNLLEVTAMGRNAAELQRAAEVAGVDLRIFFARKANKALAFVDEARRLGLGVDVASEQELRQVLDRGVQPADVVVTAAVKPRSLLDLCVAAGVTVAIDNEDELQQLLTIAETQGQTVPVALRLAPVLAAGRPPTRFGIEGTTAQDLVQRCIPAGTNGSLLRIVGVHFHLDGYDAEERVVALGQAIELIDGLRWLGHQPTFIDIGGGLPMRYLEDQAAWERFWTAHRAGLLGDGSTLTFEGHGLGLTVHDGEILGRPNVYPAAQRLIRADWLTRVLQAPLPDTTTTAAQALTDRGLQLRCEPGRSLMDGGGMTVARVAFRKQRPDGTWLIGVEMNRTQCRSTADDFLVDPLLLRPEGQSEEPTEPIEGYLVGAYCIERELLTWRRLCFPHGVAVGDLVVFPNTAGYQMHILESASHQMPLARNVVVSVDAEPQLDAIDGD